ncbi:MAG: pilus assembly protein [Comamonadaceae bacterium]|nr:MAG: pilus assembly protein [Comamonadaceae bacterium]
MAAPHLLISKRLDSASCSRSQQGVASIEFLLLFPALFLALYAIITYGLIFGAQHRVRLAAAEEGHAARRHQTAVDSVRALSRRLDAARAAATQPLGWLQAATGGNDPAPVVTAAVCANNAALTCLTVHVAYDYRAAPLLPSLLPVPATLSSESVVQISPSQLL